MTTLDALDTLAAEVFDGYLVKKDLAQQFRGQYPVPTYVGEFMLGRYCATTDADQIAAGLEMVQQSMKDRTVRAGEEELFKHRAREQGRVKIVDLLRAPLGVDALDDRAALDQRGPDLAISPLTDWPAQLLGGDDALRHGRVPGLVHRRRAGLHNGGLVGAQESPVADQELAVHDDGR